MKAPAALLPAGLAARRRIEARVAALRPAVPRTRAWVVGPSPGPARRPFHQRILDPVLGIDRAKAPDEGLRPLPALLAGAAGAGLVHMVGHHLLGMPVALVLLIAAGAALAAARAFVGARRQAVRQRMEDQFAEALGVIIRCVRAGLPVTEGMRAVSSEVGQPTAGEFRRAVDELQLGGNFDEALAAMARRCTLPDYSFFAVAVALQRQTGGNLAETLENLAETIRRRRAVRLRAQALTSETRATVAVLAVLPVVVGGILMLVSPDYVMELFVTESGRRLLGAALVIQAFGLAVIRMISRRSLS